MQRGYPSRIPFTHAANSVNWSAKATLFAEAWIRQFTSFRIQRNHQNNGYLCDSAGIGDQEKEHGTNIVEVQGLICSAPTSVKLYLRS